MANRYTAEEIKALFKGKYIKTYPVYNYRRQEWEFEIQGTSRVIRKGYNLPDEEIKNFE